MAEGEPIVLECESNKPDLESTWFKDDNEIVPNDKYDIKDDDTIHALTIHESVPEDAGEYTVEVGVDASTANVKVTGRWHHHLSSHSDNPSCHVDKSSHQHDVTCILFYGMTTRMHFIMFEG